MTVARPALLLGALAVACASLFVVHPAARASHAVPTPSVSDPPAGLRGYPLWDSYFELEPFGYEERELFVSGVARHAATGVTAPYTTRIIVTRPSDPADFNGAVLLDWVNVTAQFENAVDTMHAREMLLREGFAYVHVSAQAVGICCTPLTPKVWDPVRYAALDHPGDAFAYDMFTQIAQLFEDPASELATGVERILAAGQSQSANQLSGYIETWLPAHPEAIDIIDGVLVHGNVPGTKGFAAGAKVPVLQLLSDFEALVDPPVVDENHRLWEVAGAAHSDFFIGYQSEFGAGPRVLFGAPKLTEDEYREVIDAAGNYGEVLHPLLGACTLAGATMPMRYATSTAIHQLDVWAATGVAPDSGPRFTFDGDALAKDEHGNTLGGIRLPPMDVPVARYESTACGLGGITVPFTDAQIQGLYGTHASYFEQMAARTDEAVAGGWLLPADAIDLMGRACLASVRFGEGTVACCPYVPPPFDTGASANPATSTATCEASTPAPGAPIPAALQQPRSSTSTPTSLPATGAAAPPWPMALLAGTVALRAGARRAALARGDR